MKIKDKILYLILVSLFIPANFAFSQVDLSGYILLQVEKNGEAWYVSPKNEMRYFLGRPKDAFSVMREMGLGITNKDLDRIPIGYIENSSKPDSDGDGLWDSFEDAVGTFKIKTDTDDDGFDDKNEVLNSFNPNGNGVMPIDLVFTEKHKGKIFIQVEKSGEAWYVNPKDKKRYFLGRPDDAFSIMRNLGLGITNSDIEKIEKATVEYIIEDVYSVEKQESDYTATDLELMIHDSINQKRTENSLEELIWNNELAEVARTHSANLARENKAFTGEGYSCDFPIIHHEGLDFGIYNSDRLNSSNVYYYNSAGENIALVTAVNIKVSFEIDDPVRYDLEKCPSIRDNFDDSFKTRLDAEEDKLKKIEIIEKEITKRKNEFGKSKQLEVVEKKWNDDEYLTNETVEGWMNSPGHRKNILKDEYDETGIGVSFANGYMISTQIFIRRAECGYFGGECCTKTGYYPYCYTPYECIENICK